MVHCGLDNESDTYDVGWGLFSHQSQKEYSSSDKAIYIYLGTLQSSVCKLVSKSQAHLSMLKHMIKAKIFDQIIRGVNVLVAVLELGLNDKRRWITIATGRCVIRAGIATLGLDEWDIAVLKSIAVSS